MPTYAFLRSDGQVAFNRDCQNDAEAAAFANAQALDFERLTGQETSPVDMLLIVPGDITIEAAPTTVPPKVVAVRNRGAVTTLRQRRQNNQTIVYPVRLQLRDGRTLVIADQATLDGILAASSSSNAQGLAVAAKISPTG